MWPRQLRLSFRGRSLGGLPPQPDLLFMKVMTQGERSRREGRYLTRKPAYILALEYSLGPASTSPRRGPGSLSKSPGGVCSQDSGSAQPTGRFWAGPGLPGVAGVHLPRTWCPTLGFILRSGEPGLSGSPQRLFLELTAGFYHSG